MFITYYESPVGTIEITGDASEITGIKFTDCAQTVENSNEITENCKKQLEEYFSGAREVFDFSFKFSGTEFQEKVWNEVYKIPYGEVVTYKQIAQNIGNAKAVRAVGTAVGRNPIAIVVPCHRVVGCNNSIGGYAYGIQIKKELLRLEKFMV